MVPVKVAGSTVFWYDWVMLDRHIFLNTGAKMPIIGLGTWKAKPQEAGQAVEHALTSGYRHIDCAAIYRNEPEIGQAFKKVFGVGKIKREEVFVTGKLWNNAHRRNDVEPACRASLQDLQLDYLDLYLMHWGVAVPPGAEAEPLDENGVLVTAKVSIQETWQAMEELVRQGLVRAIGVANFTGPMLVDLLTYAEIKPAMNQIELHPYNAQQSLVDFCRYENIAVTAYSPLGSPGTKEPGEPVLLEDKEITAIAGNHDKSAAQVLIRWAMQRGTAVIPKSVNPDRIKSNFQVFSAEGGSQPEADQPPAGAKTSGGDFELSDQEMERLTKLDRRFRYTNPESWWKIPYFD